MFTLHINRTVDCLCLASRLSYQINNTKSIRWIMFWLLKITQSWNPKSVAEYYEDYVIPMEIQTEESAVSIVYRFFSKIRRAHFFLFIKFNGIPSRHCIGCIYVRTNIWKEFIRFVRKTPVNTNTGLGWLFEYNSKLKSHLCVNQKAVFFPLRNVVFYLPEDFLFQFPLKWHKRLMNFPDVKIRIDDDKYCQLEQNKHQQNTLFIIARIYSQNLKWKHSLESVTNFMRCSS